MYFDPLTSWLVALIADGISISGSRVSNSQMAQHYRESAKRTNAIMNGSILRIRDKGYFSAESALNDIKLHVEWAESSYEIKHRYAKLEISKDSFDFIVKLCEECKKEHLEQYETYANIYKKQLDAGAAQKNLAKTHELMQIHQSKAHSYQSILDAAKKGKELAIQEEADRAKKLAEQDSDGVIVLKSILAIGLCVVGFAITIAGGKLIGGLALLGAAIGGYFLFQKY